MALQSHTKSTFSILQYRHLTDKNSSSLSWSTKPDKTSLGHFFQQFLIEHLTLFLGLTLNFFFLIVHSGVCTSLWALKIGQLRISLGDQEIQNGTVWKKLASKMATDLTWVDSWGWNYDVILNQSEVSIWTQFGSIWELQWNWVQCLRIASVLR